MFCDFRISDKIEDSDIRLISQMGYKILAINKLLDESSFNMKRKGKLGTDIDIVPPCLTHLMENECGARILNRLTIQIGDITLLSKLNQSENIKKYDILAVMPTTQVALNHACTTMDVDIISYVPEQNMANCKINRKLYKQAVERGIHFEICYAQALSDSAYRRNFIQRAHLYHTVGKSLNVLITSGAENYFQIRAPYDIINLGRILGLNDALCIKSITDSARRVLLKADNRRRGKAAVFFLDEHPAPSHMEINQAKKIRVT